MNIFTRATTAFAVPLGGRSRMLAFLAVLALIPTFFVPLWRMSFLAQQYPEGLDLYIYSHALVGGDDGNDLTEINVLNHYIGMAPLRPEDFNELKWIPLVVGLIAVLTLRAAAVGTIGSVVDVMVIGGYFALFSLWSFWYKLSSYGHSLDPRASVKVAPFTPPVFGYKLVGQFHVWSYPAPGTYCFILFGLLLLGALWFSLKYQISSTETFNSNKTIPSKES